MDQTGHAGVQHLIKAEAPLDADRPSLEATIGAAENVSRQRLGVDRLHAIVLEIDAKRSTPADLGERDAARDFYQRGTQATLTVGGVDQVLAYCHQATHLTAALACPQVAGIAAQYHQAAPWVVPYLPDIAHAGKIFIGMSPLNRGALVDHSAAPEDRLAALRWAWADRRVSAVTITMSSPRHFREVAAAVGHPQSERDTWIDWPPGQE